MSFINILQYEKKAQKSLFKVQKIYTFATAQTGISS